MDFLNLKKNLKKIPKNVKIKKVCGGVVVVLVSFPLLLAFSTLDLLPPLPPKSPLGRIIERRSDHE